MKVIYLNSSKNQPTNIIFKHVRYMLKYELVWGSIVTKPQYLNKNTKELKKVSLKLNENYLNIPSVSTMKRISKLKGRIQ